MTEHIAIVDDDPVTRQILRAWLDAAGAPVLELATGEEALSEVHRCSVVCLDLGLEDLDGLDVLRRLRAAVPELTVIVVTGDRQVETAVTAMREGAYDYLTKPLDRDRFQAVLGRALERARMQRQLATMKSAGGRRLGEIVGESPAMDRLAQQIESVVDSDIAVCVFGESGTGKELVARALHAHGRRQDGPFVAVNCAAIAPSLQESELFGHERGAFTGAIGTYRGRFEQAHGGTLFLDEIGEMSAMTQAALLRAIQEKTIRRVGGTADIATDVRIVCATHRDLEAEVREGRFREDLYFRLVVYPIHVPPLRERASDIPLLVAHALEQLRADVGRRVTTVTPAALDLLVRQPWPGNVRELRNVVHRAMVACSGDTIDEGHVRASLGVGRPPPASVVVPIAQDSGVRTLREIEREAIARALEVTGGNVTRAAKMLGLGRATLYRRIAEEDLVITRAG